MPDTALTALYIFISFTVMKKCLTLFSSHSFSEYQSATLPQTTLFLP